MTDPIRVDGIVMRTIVDLPDPERAQLDALCTQRRLSRAEALRQALRLWQQQQQHPRISVITWIEVLVGCRHGEREAVQAWLETYPRLRLDDAISQESVKLRQRHSLKVPDAIHLATARCREFTQVTRNHRDVPLTLGGVLHPYML
jgi:predicted nucleic acid-binding protein